MERRPDHGPVQKVPVTGRLTGYAGAPNQKAAEVSGQIVAEYQSEPSPGQLALVKKITASRDVTAIVGQGPHGVQPIERVNGKYVVFSEGNLVSNQSPEAGLPASSPDGSPDNPDAWRTERTSLRSFVRDNRPRSDRW